MDLDKQDVKLTAVTYRFIKSHSPLRLFNFKPSREGQSKENS